MTYRASAGRDALELRARILARIRAFFAARRVLEVETPTLSAAGVTDLALESVTARVRSLSDRTFYLHTSPEYAMKRLLAAGSGDIYQICRVFRDDEIGRWHQPEFTLLEWYRQGWDEVALMQEVDELFRDVLACTASDVSGPTIRLTYAEAFEAGLGVGPDEAPAAIASKLRALGIDVPGNLSNRELVDLAFGAAVVPRLARHSLTFVYDFPADQAALARIKAAEPPVAARFEVFARGIELANGFAELTDPLEQRRRFNAELAARSAANRRQPPLDEAFLAAVGNLPPCAGVAVGVDRLVALAGGFDGIASALAFVHDAN